MANDVTIVVEASLGDTLMKLELAKLAINDLDDAGTTAGRNLGDESNRSSFASRIGILRKSLSDLGAGQSGPLGLVTRGFGNLASAILSPLDASLKLSENFGQMGQAASALVGVVASLGVAWVGFAAAVAAATFAATALADILGTLIAIVADFVAPLTVVTSLLGLLGIGFGLAAKRAADGGGKLSAFSKQLDVLKSMFGRTSDILAHVFLPYLMQLAHAGEVALNFFDRIAKLPLKEAFQRIATQGTQLLTRFINGVSAVLARPIRLAFKLAFGKGPADNEFQSTVSAWWNRLTNFLFGYVDRHPLTRLDILKGAKPTVRHVDGIFEPLVEWFNRHHFTRQGIQIGRQILNGILNSGMKNRIVDFLGQVFHDSGTRALHAFWNALNQPLLPLLMRLWHTIDQQVNDAGHRWRQSIIASMGSAWDWVKNKVSGIWDWVVNLIESPLHINIDWPSPPSWLTGLLGGGGGSVAPSRGGGGRSSPVKPPSGGGTGPTYRLGASAAMLGGIHIHMHTGPLDSYSARRKTAADISRMVEQRWVRSGL